MNDCRFTMTDRKGKPMPKPVAYFPFPMTIGDRITELALHCVVGTWVVSDPASGARIMAVRGKRTTVWKGIPVGDKPLTLTMARIEARAQLKALVERLTPEEFWRVVDRARAKHGQEVAA
jgi:hypothetical protein